MFTLSSMTTKYFIDSKIARPAGKGIKIGIEKGEPVYKTWGSIYPFVDGSNEMHHAQNAPHVKFICDGLNLEEKKSGNHSAYARSGKGFAFDWLTREGYYLEQKVGKNLYNGNDKVDFCTGNPRYVQSVLNTLLCEDSYVPSKKPCFMLHAYIKEGFNGDMVLRMKLVNMKKALEIQTSKKTEYKIFNIERKRVYKRLRIKLSSIQKWVGKRVQNRQVSDYLVENDIERDFTACIFNVQNMTFNVVTDNDMFHDYIDEIK